MADVKAAPLEEGVLGVLAKCGAIEDVDPEDVSVKKG